MQEIESLFRELVADHYSFTSEHQDLNDLDVADLEDLAIEVEEKFDVNFAQEDLEAISNAYEILQLLRFYLLKTSCEQLVTILAKDRTKKELVAKLQQVIQTLGQDQEALIVNINKLQLPSNFLPLVHNLVNEDTNEAQEQASTLLQVLEGE